MYRDRVLLCVAVNLFGANTNTSEVVSYSFSVTDHKRT
jgi:hypothetical protein